MKKTINQFQDRARKRAAAADHGPDSPIPYVLPDSGARRDFPTGSRRDVATGKGRYDLVPEYPIERLAKHFENGSAKYGDRNWEKGQPLSVYVNSAQRHMAKFKMGDRSEDHLAAVLWNVSCLLWTENEIREGRLPDELRDVPWPDSLPFGG